MSQAALSLAVVSLLLALWPLLPHTQVLGLLAAGLGVGPALLAVFLALRGRGRAWRSAEPLRFHTVALGLSVMATVFTGFWLLAILGFYLSPTSR